MIPQPLHGQTSAEDNLGPDYIHGISFTYLILRCHPTNLRPRMENKLDFDAICEAIARVTWPTHIHLGRS